MDTSLAEQQKKNYRKSNMASSQTLDEDLKNVPAPITKLAAEYPEIFGPLPAAGTVPKSGIMDLQLKPGYEDKSLTCRPFPASEVDLREMERQCEELL